MKTILLRFGEIYLKGNNQKLFKKALLQNIKNALKGEDCTFQSTHSRFIVQTPDQNLNSVLNKLKKVFGLVSMSVAEELDADKLKIEQYISTLKLTQKTFRISVKRGDKNFPVSSVDFERILGGIVLQNNQHIKVNLSNPEIDIKVDIRENCKAYVFTDEIQGAGGLPLGTAGKGLLMLSGGIDSPVAGYLTAKRGLKLDALHFHSYPYTSEQAKQKVINLAKILAQYNPDYKIYFVSLTEIQEEIRKHCQPEYMITLMRRFMYKIGEMIALKNGHQAIVTGENLGQVASQTVESLTVTNAVLTTIPMFRPLLTYDKTEIIKLSEHIGTFETSILPYEDCCTVFLPKRPIIKPKLEKVLKEEAKLDVERLINNAMSSIEVLKIN